MSTEYKTYLAGVMVLGAFYEPLKGAFPSGLTFVLAVVVYLLALRSLGKRLTLDREGADSPDG